MKLKTLILVLSYFKIFTLWVCFCTLCSNYSHAEIKKYYELKDDLFEYFRVADYQYNSAGAMIGSLHGAMDINDKELVPIKFDLVFYHSGQNDRDGWFETIEKKTDGVEWVGAYSKDGECLIPTYRQFTDLSKDITEGKEYFSYKGGDKEVGVCDANGKIIANMRVNKDAEYIFLMQDIHLYWVLYKDGEKEYFDYSLNSLGNDANKASSIAKQKNLKKPLADSPSKSTSSLTRSIPNTSTPSCDLAKILVGKWVIPDSKFDELQFNSDGTFESAWLDTTLLYLPLSERGTWSVNESILTLLVEDKNITYYSRYKVNIVSSGRIEIKRIEGKSIINDIDDIWLKQSK